ncbi:MAG: hypothetical protein ACRENE_07330 [Polyangiaceae bacterium]
MSDSNDIRRLRGAAELLGDAVEHGASAIERVHLATVARPFAILEAIPPTALVARGVHVAHDAIAQGVYGSIRMVTRLARAAVTTAIDIAGGASGSSGDAAAPADAIEPPAPAPVEQLPPTTGSSPP